MAIDWSKGYSSTCYAKRVDPATWRDVEVIELTGGTVKREPTGKRQSADISCVRYHIDVEQWIRVYMDVQQGGASDHVALFVKYFQGIQQNGQNGRSLNRNNNML